jgi:hypothetical protein
MNSNQQLILKLDNLMISPKLNWKLFPDSVVRSGFYVSRQAFS